MDKVTLRDDVTQEQINQAIADGIDWMVTQPMPSGYEGVARTALAVAKLCDYAVERGNTPQNDLDYAGYISSGLDYILDNAYTHPDGGIRLNANPPSHDVYNTGIGMMALAAYRCPECPVDVGVTGVNNYMDLLQKKRRILRGHPEHRWRLVVL
jgi:hypothetical protein